MERPANDPLCVPEASLLAETQGLYGDVESVVVTTSVTFREESSNRQRLKEDSLVGSGLWRAS